MRMPGWLYVRERSRFGPAARPVEALDGRVDTLPLDVVEVSRRRPDAGPGLSGREQALADVLDGHLRYGGSRQRLANRLGLPVATLAAALTRLQRAADAYAEDDRHDRPCTPSRACGPQWVCDLHLGPLQDWWGVLEPVTRALLALVVTEPL